DTPTTNSSCLVSERCVGAAHQVCKDGAWADDPCPQGTECEPAPGTCKACDCTSPATCVDTTTLERCDCFGTKQITCPEGQVCDAAAGACADLICSPGVASCVGQDTLQTCNEYGTGFTAPVTCRG